MLKRIFTLVVLATMVAGYAQAQFSFGAKAGFNLTSMYGDIENVKMKPGFQAGLVADYSFIEAFAVQAGVMFAQQGYKSDKYTGLDGKEYTDKLNLNYIQIPINAMYKFDLGASMKLFVQAGPYLGFAVSGKYKDDELDEKFDVEFGSEDNETKAFDFGLGVGAGLQYNSFQLGVGYNFGLTDLSNVSNNSTKNNGLAITLTFLFL